MEAEQDTRSLHGRILAQFNCNAESTDQVLLDPTERKNGTQIEFNW